jgi:hypothetical protein
MYLYPKFPAATIILLSRVADTKLLYSGFFRQLVHEISVPETIG